MKTTPLAHQLEDFHRFKAAPSWAAFWDPGLGKTKEAIDIAYAHYVAGDIKRLLVVAPNIVHSNWITDELPKHAWDGIDTRTMAWHSRKARTKGQVAEGRQLLEFGGFSIAAMTYEGICTDAGTAFAAEFVKTRPTMIVADELHRLQTHDSRRSKLMTKAGKFAVIRAGLTGTPVGNSPFSVFSQVRFLDPDFWKKRGIGGWTAFKHEFGVWEEKWSARGKYPELVEYKNLGRLQTYLAEIGSRRRREDALDLPPQVFMKRRFDLSREQRRVYDELKAQFRAELEDKTILEVPIALTRIMKLHQIACGHVRDAEGADHAVGDDQPRLDALEEICEDCPEQAIVWTRFRTDGRMILERLNGAPGPFGKRAALVNGDVGPKDRERSLAAFRGGDVKFLVANPLTMGVGVTLNEAKTTINYSHDHSLIQRQQSDARNYRHGQTQKVRVIDMIANGTVDEMIIAALIENMDVAALVQGDAYKEWIR